MSVPSSDLPLKSERPEPACATCTVVRKKKCLGNYDAAGGRCSQCRKFKLSCIHGRPSWLKDQTHLRNFRDGVRAATTSHRKKARHAKTPAGHPYPTITTGTKCTRNHAHDGLSSAWNTFSPMDTPKTRGEAPVSCAYPTGDASALGGAAGSSSSEPDFNFQADLFGYEHLLFPIHDAPNLPPLPFTNMGIDTCAKRETVGSPDVFEGTTSPVNTASAIHGPPETFSDAQCQAFER